MSNHKQVMKTNISMEEKFKKFAKYIKYKLNKTNKTLQQGIRKKN